MAATPFIVNLQDVGMKDLADVGGKNASLGEMIRNLNDLGIRIPGGFIITVSSFHAFMEHNRLDRQIAGILSRTDLRDLDALRRCGESIRALIVQGEMPQQIRQDILDAYTSLSERYNTRNLDVAVRSSATTEDLPDASFAGQQETFLNISGPDQLIDAVKKCFASLFTDRALSYRQSLGFGNTGIGLAVCVQRMVRSDLGASGVAFSLDTESGFQDVVIINGSRGLGELVVQGSVSPDEFIVFKPALKQKFDAIIEKKLGSKEQKMIYSRNGRERVEILDTTLEERHQFCISDETVLELARWVMIIEHYYSKLKGQWSPMDIEWALDGYSQELFIVQARPETIHSRKNRRMITEYTISGADRSDRVLIKGISVGDKIACGPVKVIGGEGKHLLGELDFRAGDVLVTDMTDPDWEPIMKKASAIITNKGGRTCHAAIVARELGVPAIVGCGNATSVLETGRTVTASCAEGDVGLVYDGEIPFLKREQDLDSLPTVGTPVMLNVASPDIAFSYAHFPAQGVGLAREEFIINNYIQVHPMALLKHRALNDEELTRHINMLTRGFRDESDFFIRKLAFGIARIASAFYPQKVIVRFSDFKTNEYYNLPGGKHFEPAEENPMIGWRGASRYYSPEYKEAFGLECLAIRKVREEMGLKNVVVMIPFCRTVTELLRVYETMAEFGLKRGEDGLQVYLMAEIPSNIILAEQFARHIDGFSIGS
ncbi:MAG TPA: phosphoenolpyruvate synthase, partial [Sphingobacteriaceae bacterium]